MTDKELLNALPAFPHKEGGQRFTKDELESLMEHIRKTTEDLVNKTNETFGTNIMSFDEWLEWKKTQKAPKDS